MTLEGHVVNGQIVLNQNVALPEGMKVRVELLTPPDSGEVAESESNAAKNAPLILTPRGLNPEQAADLRGRLKAFAEDWDRPEMDVYDAV
jgi:hypothetical protein